MSLSLRIACVLLAIAAQLAANTGTGTLTLVTPQTGINKLTITVGATASGLTASDTQTTNVTGTVTGSIDADPTTGATTAMTITGGNIAMSNMRFVLKALIFITVADISTANMGGTAYTPDPKPAPVTPNATGGTFDAALHRVVINRGTLTGAITYSDPDTPVNADFASAPVEGAGIGTGTIVMVPGVADATHRTMQATITIPVDFTDTQDMSGTPVTIKVKGTIKAAGPVRIPLNVLPSPTFTPTGGKYPAGQQITITGETGSTIFYRLNGGAEQSAPSPFAGLTVPAYPAALSISAYARKSGWVDSPTLMVTYTTPAPTSSPVFNPPSGEYPAGQPVTITGESGSTIYYRINGGAEQSAASPVSGLSVPAYPATLSISAYAKKSNMADSATTMVAYTSPAPTTAPVFNPPTGEYPAGQPITITGESGSTIYYRINSGTEQSVASPVSGLVVPAHPATLSISAYAKKSGMADSATTTVAYTSPPSPFQAWASVSFPGITDPAIIGPEADPDDDEQSNSIEFALGGNPKDAADNARIHALIAEGENPDAAKTLLMTIAVRVGTPAFSATASPSATNDGIIYSVQGSVDLADYNAPVLVVAPVVTGLPPAPSGYEYRTFSLDRTNNIPITGFLRVRVSAVP